jgi:hypothetical protein
MYATSTYPQGGSMTTAGGFDAAPADYLRALLARETARRSAPAPAPVAMRSAPAPQPTYAGPTGEEAGLGRETARLQLEALRNRVAAEKAQQDAMANPAPMRVVSGFNMTPGYMQDPNAMNAYQRQAYLPQGAGMAGPLIPQSRAAVSPSLPQSEEVDPYGGPSNGAQGPGAAFSRQMMANARRRA